LELQFKKSQKITPKELGIKARFCLDANSEECWKEFEKKSKAKNKNFDKNSTEEETVSKEKKNKLKKYVDDAKLELYKKNKINKKDIYKSPTIKNNFNIVKKVKIKDMIDTDISFLNSRNLDLDKTYDEKMNINMKKRLLDDLENSILPNLPLEINENEIIIPDEPYSFAINYLRQIINYKVPLEKLIIISYLSVLIMNNIDKYWQSRKDKLPSNFLNLDADEIMSIYLYIIYKANFSTIVDHIDFIEHFTTSSLKQSALGYYYTTFEGCIRYIEELSEEK